jgi:hypothetical protein
MNLIATGNLGMVAAAICCQIDAIDHVSHLIDFSIDNLLDGIKVKINDCIAGREGVPDKKWGV